MRIIIPEKVCTLHHSIPFIDLTQKLFYLSEVGLIPIATIAALMGQCFSWKLGAEGLERDKEVANNLTRSHIIKFLKVLNFFRLL